MSGFGWFLFGGVLGAAGSWYVDNTLRPRFDPENCPVGFRRVPGASAGGSFLHIELTAPYHALVTAFGKPDKGDDYKVFNEWVFVGPGGAYSIYDYRSDGSKKRTYKWHISGVNEQGADAFVGWLARMLGK